MLRVRDDGTNSYLEWLNPSNITAAQGGTDDGKWETLVSGLTTGAIMGFTPFNNTNANLLVFCNAVDNYSTWSGATATVASVTSNTIVTNTADLTLEGFSATGSLMVNGVEYAYTGISSTTFTGVTPDPTSDNPGALTGVAQKHTEYASNPKGNILLTASARVWLSGVSQRESTLYYSSVADASDFSAGTNPDDAGIEDFPDGGGAITLLDSRENQKIIIHKKDAVLLFRLEYTDTAKIAYLDVVALSDDIGATNQKAGAGLNQVSYYTTGVEGIKDIQRSVFSSDLNIGSLTDIILPTLDGYDFSEAAMVYFPPKKVLYLACKSSSSENHNDKIVSYYIKQSTEGTVLGDISIDDAFIADWIVDGDTLYGFSSVDYKVYKMFDRKSARGASINHVWASKEETFGEPAQLKEFNTVYVEGFIASKTKVKISIQYGLLGANSAKDITLEWDGDYVTDKKVSALGTDVIGTNSIGSRNSNIRDSYIFSVPIHVDASERYTRYKIKAATVYDDETDNDCYWAISNISTNPTVVGINKNKTINTNS